MLFFADSADTRYQNGSDECVHQDANPDKSLKDRSKNQQAQYRDEQEKESVFKVVRYTHFFEK